VEGESGSAAPVFPATEGGSRPGLSLLVTSFAALFLELLLIRWESSEIPVLAYFKNFTLLSVFTGLGAGCLLARSPRDWFVPSLWVAAVLALTVSCADFLGLDRLVFPEPRIDVWGRFFEVTRLAALVGTARNLGAIMLVLAANAAVFLGPGQAVGRWLASGSPLAMYRADIAGSLAGVLAFAALSWLWTPPAAWLAVAGALLAAAALVNGVRWKGALPPLAALLVVAGLSAWRAASGGGLVRWSPYYRIEVQESYAPGMPEKVPFYWWLGVNRDYHQVMMDLSDEFGSRLRVLRGQSGMTMDAILWWQQRLMYDFPYLTAEKPFTVLVGGAGTGNDVAGALRNGAGRVTAVEIDPAILSIGRSTHPSRPYASERVTAVNADMRSFLRRDRGTYDVVTFGLLDSHTALSSLGSLRLDNYVYTVEGIRDAVAHASPRGRVSMAFCVSHRTWLARRIFANITEATGQVPVATMIRDNAMFLFGPGVDPVRARRTLARMGFPAMEAVWGAEKARPSTDDWPFLYSNPAGQPVVYYLSLALLVALAWLLVGWAAGAGSPGSTFRGLSSIDAQMFLLGAGFMLVETKALAELALLFGSTWVVNTFVFAGIFVMILLANRVAEAGWGRRAWAWNAMLAAALAAWFAVPREALNALDYWPRAVAGTALTVLPILFAGVIFSSAFAQRRRAEQAFGANLCGAVAGGAAEALSLAFGIRFLTLLAAVFYGGAWLASRGRAGAAEDRA
jgi:hypothetical protein